MSHQQIYAPHTIIDRPDGAQTTSSACSNSGRVTAAELLRMVEIYHAAYKLMGDLITRIDQKLAVETSPETAEDLRRHRR